MCAGTPADAGKAGVSSKPEQWQREEGHNTSQVEVMFMVIAPWNLQYVAVEEVMHCTGGAVWITILLTA